MNALTLDDVSLYVGRTSGLIVVIPAHFIGGVLGVTALKILLTRLGLDYMVTSVVPIIYHYDGLAFGWQVRSSSHD